MPNGQSGLHDGRWTGSGPEQIGQGRAAVMFEMDIERYTVVPTYEANLLFSEFGNLICFPAFLALDVSI